MSRFPTQPADDCGPEPNSDQDDWRHDYLHEKCCLGARRLSPADQHRARQRAAISVADDPKGGERIHVERDLGHQGPSASNQDDGATAVTDLTVSGSVDFCSGCDQRGGQGNADCRVPDRFHDSHFSGQLAKHCDHRDLDPSGDTDVHYCAQRDSANDKHHDARWTGTMLISFYHLESREKVVTISLNSEGEAQER